MAGKHPFYGGSTIQSNTAQHVATALALPPAFPGGRLDKAYAEGRLAVVINGANPLTGSPFPNGTPEDDAWERGGLVGFNSGSAGTHNGSEFHTGVPDLP